MTDNRVVVDLNRADFDNAVLMALEKDTGAVPICGEIIRCIKIAMRKERIRNQRLRNLMPGGGKVKRNAQ